MIERQLTKILKQVYRAFPVVSLNGPRQSGKSTLLKNTFTKLPYVNLENPDDLRLALQDPRGFLAQYTKGVIIDEVQNAPELFSYIQGIVDANNKIKFVLSGSQNFLMNEKITQTLAGRVGVLTLLPFSLIELENAKKLKASLNDVLYTGFYPRLYDKRISPAIFYPSYLQTYVQRDVQQITRISDLNLFLKFIKLVAGRVGQLVNYSSLASDVGISANTVKEWISILEASYIIYLLRPHHNNFAKRLVQMPKIYFIDTGLLCYLLEIDKPNQLTTHFARGGIFENFVIIDIVKARYNAAKMPNCFFWRDNHGKEIDCIIDNKNKLTPIEIKSSQTKSLHFFDGIKYYKNLAKEKSAKGYVIYGGKEIIEIKDGTMLPWNKLDKLL
jgi:uncharacterized protein